MILSVSFYQNRGSRTHQGPPGCTQCCGGGRGDGGIPTWGKGCVGKRRNGPQCPTWGSWPELRNHGGYCHHFPGLSTSHGIAVKSRGPRAHPLQEEQLTWTERGARTSKPPHKRKSGTEVAPETTTPTRLWGLSCLLLPEPHAATPKHLRLLGPPSQRLPTTPAAPSSAC